MPEVAASKSNDQTRNKKKHLGTSCLGSEVGLKLRCLADLGALAVASVGGPLATRASGAGGSVVLVLGAAAGALAGRALVWKVNCQCVC